MCTIVVTSMILANDKSCFHAASLLKSGQKHKSKIYSDTMIID